MSFRSSSRAASAKARSQVKPPEPPPAPAAPSLLSLPVPHWTRWVLFALAALLLISVFTSESADSDTWWHLKTGQYIVQQHKLPAPDPFAWTTYLGKASYPGEEKTRYFNLTHEWLAQVMFYAAYAAKGFTGLILLRAFWLTAFCALGGAIVYRRTKSYYRAIGAMFAILSVLRVFVADRPQIITYAFIALTILIVENRRYLWVLPPLLLFWANCHAGFIMGWVVMGAYCAEALYYRLRGKPVKDERMLWICCVGAVLISGLNPNVFNVIPVLGYYRQSPLQSQIWEWQKPKYWELSPFTVLMYGSAAFLALNYKRTRPVEWILFALFAISGLMAMRNIFLIGLWGAILIATYLPKRETTERTFWNWTAAAMLGIMALWFFSYIFNALVLAILIAVVAMLIFRRWIIAAEAVMAVLMLFGIAYQASHKLGFQFRGADWRYPSDAADFVLKHHLKGRIFNTYGQGGYLLWRLWPDQQVFVDGRALNEGVNRDATRMNMNADSNGGVSGEQLLKNYGIDIIMMDSFDATGGTAYYLPAALADPSQKEWKLVYQDIHAVIYMRNPPADVPALKSLDALEAMERQCAFYVQHGQPMCSRGLVDVFGKIGDRQRYDGWLSVYRKYRGSESFTAVQR